MAKELSANVVFTQCDLRNIEALQLAFQLFDDRLGAASVLGNNAARDDRHDWSGVTSKIFDERMATNLHHMFFAIQAVADRLSTWGQIPVGKLVEVFQYMAPQRLRFTV